MFYIMHILKRTHTESKTLHYVTIFICMYFAVKWKEHFIHVMRPKLYYWNYLLYSQGFTRTEKLKTFMANKRPPSNSQIHRRSTLAKYWQLTLWYLGKLIVNKQWYRSSDVYNSNNNLSIACVPKNFILKHINKFK